MCCAVLKKLTVAGLSQYRVGRFEWVNSVQRVKDPVANAAPAEYNINMKTKLKWRNVECVDLDVKHSWIEAAVKPIGWLYVVEPGPKKLGYTSYLLFDGRCEEIRLSEKEFKTVEQAKQFCEKHLHGTFLKLQKLFL